MMALSEKRTQDQAEEKGAPQVPQKSWESPTYRTKMSQLRGLEF